MIEFQKIRVLFSRINGEQCIFAHRAFEDTHREQI